MRQTQRVRLALAAAATLLVVLVANPAAADETPAPTQAEAWYQACVAPAGCDALPAASPYPADTLHVGTSGGNETARTYVEIDLGGVPSDAQIVGGTLSVTPAGADAGSVRPEDAAITACLTTRPFAPERGKFGPPHPPTDCAVSSNATFADGVFTVDLAPFADSWANSGFAALALVPTEGEADAWHVAIAAKERVGGVPITATLTYVDEEDVEAPASVDLPPAAGPSLLSDDLDEGTTSETLPLAPEPTGGLPAADEPEVALPPLRGGPATPVVAVDRTGFAYPAVWLLPLALLLVGGLLGRALTRPISVTTTAAT